jgi:CRP/FNR family transcriptional activator FtrB
MTPRTLHKSPVVLLPSQHVRDIFKIDHAFSRSELDEMAQCYRSVVKNAKDLKLRSSIERLANYLLRQNWRAGSTGEFDLKVEKRLLASYLGMTPENLSRAIKALRPYGVKISGMHVTILDVDDLATLAKPTPSIDDPYH